VSQANDSVAKEILFAGGASRAGATRRSDTKCGDGPRRGNRRHDVVAGERGQTLGVIVSHINPHGAAEGRG
jgi:hypothetical protein